jgi:hypothetical protein
LNAVKSILILGALISFQALAKDLDLRCVALNSGQVVLDRNISLVSGTRGLFIGKAAGLDFILTHSGENKVELQAFNAYEPSRTFATANISEAGSFVELSIWKREFVVEARCTAY